MDANETPFEEVSEVERCADCERELDVNGDCNACSAFWDHVDAQIDQMKEEE